MALVAKVLAAGEFRLDLASGPFAVREALGRITASPALQALSADHRGTVEIVLAEVLNNIAEHAYAGGQGDIAVEVSATPAGLVCVVVDHGREMPDGTPPPGDLPLEDYPEGGFGWHLIRTLTLDLGYNRVGGQNRLRFVIPA